MLEYGNRAALVAEGEALTAALADAVRGDGKRLGIRRRARRYAGRDSAPARRRASSAPEKVVEGDDIGDHRCIGVALEPARRDERRQNALASPGCRPEQFDAAKHLLLLAC